MASISQDAPHLDRPFKILYHGHERAQEAILAKLIQAAPSPTHPSWLQVTPIPPSWLQASPNDPTAPLSLLSQPTPNFDLAILLHTSNPTSPRQTSQLWESSAVLRALRIPVLDVVDDSPVTTTPPIPTRTTPAHPGAAYTPSSSTIDLSALSALSPAATRLLLTRLLRPSANSPRSAGAVDAASPSLRDRGCDEDGSGVDAPLLVVAPREGEGEEEDTYRSGGDLEKGGVRARAVGDGRRERWKGRGMHCVFVLMVAVWFLVGYRVRMWVFGGLM